MALNTDRWTRLPHGMVQGLEALGAPAAVVDDETREFVAQIFGDNLDLFFRWAQTGGVTLYLEAEANGCLPFPPSGGYPAPPHAPA